MDFYSKDAYKDFEKVLLENIKLEANLVIISLPGMGATYFVKKFMKKHSPSDVSFIYEAGQELSKYNILDLNFDKNENALSVADEYFRKADLDQKFALIISTPNIIKSDSYRKSFLSTHIYSTHFFKAWSKEDTIFYAKDLNPELFDADAEKIFDLVGGMGRLVKFFAINKDKLKMTTSELLKDADLQKVFLPPVEAIKRCYPDVLSSLGVTEEGVFVGKLFKTYFDKNPIPAKIEIQTFDDLSFSEKGERSNETLTQTERNVLEYLVEEGFITREKIADFKWGEGSYDDYSDQAINKTMQRLTGKVKKYAITPVPKAGYRIE